MSLMRSSRMCIHRVVNQTWHDILHFCRVHLGCVRIIIKLKLLHAFIDHVCVVVFIFDHAHSVVISKVTHVWIATLILHPASTLITLTCHRFFCKRRHSCSLLQLHIYLFFNLAFDTFCFLTEIVKVIHLTNAELLALWTLSMGKTCCAIRNRRLVLLELARTLVWQRGVIKFTLFACFGHLAAEIWGPLFFNNIHQRSVVIWILAICRNLVIFLRSSCLVDILRLLKPKIIKLHGIRNGSVWPVLLLRHNRKRVPEDLACIVSRLRSSKVGISLLIGSHCRISSLKVATEASTLIIKGPISIARVTFVIKWVISLVNLVAWHHYILRHWNWCLLSSNARFRTYYLYVFYLFYANCSWSTFCWIRILLEPMLIRWLIGTSSICEVSIRLVHIYIFLKS